MLTLNESGEFIADGKPLGVVAKQTRQGRWQYRPVNDKHVIASGMTPDKFAARYWFRNDYQETK